jgi:hypothetical protein
MSDMDTPHSSTFSRSSKSRLTRHDLARFPDDTVFHRIARAVCEAGCLPRKELYEAWEVARRVRRRFRGRRVVDLCGGHGLVGQLMLVLDDSSPGVTIVDRMIPASAVRLQIALAQVWPRMAGRVAFNASNLSEVLLTAEDLVVSIHACGALTDTVLARASAAGAPVAVLPCCHHLDRQDDGDLSGWLDGPVAIDVVRARRLASAGWRIWTHTIPADITRHNRLLMAAPPEFTGAAST